MKQINFLLDILRKISSFVAVIALIITFALVFLNVVTRYIFGTGFAWSEEGARYGLVALIILGVIEITRKREHFCVDLLTNIVPGPILKIMEVLQDLMMLALTGILLQGAFNMAALNWHNKTPALAMPSWIPYALLLFSSAVSILYLLLILFQDIGLIKKEETSLNREEENGKC